MIQRLQSVGCIWELSEPDMFLGKHAVYYLDSDILLSTVSSFQAPSFQAAVMTLRPQAGRLSLAGAGLSG